MTPSRKPREVQERAEPDEPEGAPDAAHGMPGSENDADFYTEHFDFVWRNAMRVGCQEDWVEDAVHEVFVVATRKRHDFEGRSGIRTWLFAITYRVVLRMQRDRARHARRLRGLALEHQDLARSSASPRAEDARYLRQLLARLDESKRVIVILTELEGMTSKEIAEVLGLKQGTVDSRLRAARQELLAMVERERARWGGER